MDNRIEQRRLTGHDRRAEESRDTWECSRRKRARARAIVADTRSNAEAGQRSVSYGIVSERRGLVLGRRRQGEADVARRIRIARDLAVIVAVRGIDRELLVDSGNELELGAIEFDRARLGAANRRRANLGRDEVLLLDVEQRRGREQLYVAWKSARVIFDPAFPLLDRGRLERLKRD